MPLSWGVGRVLEGAVLAMLEAGETSVAFQGRILTTLLTPCGRSVGGLLVECRPMHDCCTSQWWYRCGTKLRSIHSLRHVTQVAERHKLPTKIM